ncbi:hypothetical protein F0726_01044 [Acidithiobacillus caldus]|nr:hypothetical protein F0726_01044 [Acidithiobacillus caldus]
MRTIANIHPYPLPTSTGCQATTAQGGGEPGTRSANLPTQFG